MRKPATIYSIGVRFAGGGIGNIAHHDAQSLHEAGMLQKLLCGSAGQSDIPPNFVRQMGLASRLLRRLALFDKSGQRVLRLHNRLYDRWVRSQLEPCDLFLSWNGFGLEALRQAKKMGALTIVYRASAHPLHQRRLLAEEYARWGLPYVPATPHLEQATLELQEADTVIIPSDFVRESCIQEGIPAAKLTQIPFGVDHSRFHAPDRPPQAEPFRVLFLGQIGVRKGVPYLLQAWEQLGWEDAELWLAGRVQPDFESWLAPYRRLPGLQLRGHLSDPAEALRQCHLFVFPTIEEGSALVVYEAMATGLPVITTPNAGSLIRDRQDGVIVPIRDADALAAQIAALRASPQRRQALGEAAQQRVRPYTWSRYGQQLVAKLEEAWRQHA